MVPASFVGRDAELGLLTGLLAQQNRTRGPVAALISGDPGSGKSRLLAEVRHHLTGRRHVRLQGRQLEQQIQLAAAREILKLLADVPDEGESLRDLLTGKEQVVSALTPVRVFEAAARCLSGIGPVVVEGDDLHWMDEMTLALLHYLLRSALSSATPMTFLAASRPTPALGKLAIALEHLLGDDRYRMISLGPLGREAGKRLAKELSPEIDDATALSLWRRAQGSPFWIERLAGQKDLSRDDLSQVLAAPLAAIGGDASKVLAFVVQTGQPLLVEELKEMVGWAGHRVEKAAAELVSAGLVVFDTGGGVRAAHDIIRLAAAEWLPEGLQRQVHRRLAPWLEVRADADPRVLLGALEHRLAGGLPIGEAALALATSPHSRSLGQTGVRHLVSLTGDAHLRSIELATALARLARAVGDHRLAFDLWSHLASLADNPDAGLAALAASEAAMVMGLETEAWNFQRMARGHEKADPAMAVELDAHESALHRWLGRRVDEATAAADRALAGAEALVISEGGREVPARRAYLKAVVAAADAALVGRDPTRMLKLAEILAPTAAGFDDQLHVRGLAEGALALRLLGKSREAEQQARRAWDEAQRLVLPQMGMETGPLLARMLFTLGRLAEAQQVVDEYLALGNRLAEFRPARVFQLVVPSLLQAALGDWRAATDSLKDAAETEQEPHYRLSAWMWRAALMARLDPQRSAATVAADVSTSLADAANSGCRRCQAEADAKGAESLARVGLIDASARLVAAFDNDPERGDRYLRHCRLVALAACATEDPETAVNAWEAAIAEAEVQEMVFEALCSSLDLARALIGPDRGRAAEVAREAGAIATRIGAVTETRVAEQILRSLGVRTWRRGSAIALGALTERERQIAEMIGAGASNPEIAQTLFLSRKTIERHVSNILAKLGARNRAELARVLGSAS